MNPKSGDDDPLLAELARLPGPTLSASARQVALARAEAELGRRSRPGSARPGFALLRWLGTEALVPTVLVIGGALYLTGAWRVMSQVYGPQGVRGDRLSLSSPPIPRYMTGPRRLGGVAEWSKATVLKTVARKRRGFESLLLLSLFNKY